LIPSGARDHVEEMVFTAPSSGLDHVEMFLVGTHMHYVGRDMKVSIERATPTNGDPAEECLLQTPSWNFAWQRGYEFDAPIEKLPRVRAGDVFRMRCTYDNTLDNPYVAKALDDQNLKAPIDVRLGEETLDEMCLAAVGYLVPLN
jgi:hypothetical protein